MLKLRLQAPGPYKDSLKNIIEFFDKKWVPDWCLLQVDDYTKCWYSKGVTKVSWSALEFPIQAVVVEIKLIQVQFVKYSPLFGVCLVLSTHSPREESNPKT